MKIWVKVNSRKLKLLDGVY